MSAIFATVQALLAGLETHAIVADRVNPIEPPQDEAFPSIVVGLISEADLPNLDGRSGLSESRVSIECRAETATAAVLLGEAVKNDLLRIHSTPYAGCKVSFLQEGTDVTGIGTNRTVKTRTLDFYVWWRASN